MRHLDIIKIWLYEMGIQPENQVQERAIIKRNLRAAKMLEGYSDQDIIATIKKVKSLEYITHFTLETLSRYIDEVVAERKKAQPKIVRFEKVMKDGKELMRPIYEKAS